MCGTIPVDRMNVMNTRSFPEQLTDLWRTRPVRLPEHGPLAGVCAGIGVRYGVDPVLVRVAFVVSALFGGAGVVLYLAAWVLFTRHGDQVSALESLVGRGHSSESSTKVIVLLVALAISASAVGPVGFGSGGSGFIGMVLMLGGWWLLYQRRPEPPTLPPPAGDYTFTPGVFPPTPFAQYPFAGGFAPAPTTTADATVADTGPGQHDRASDDGAVSLSKDDTATSLSQDDTATTASPAGTAESASTPDAGSTASPVPPAWDPLGVAPFAWDLPEPAPRHEPAVAATGERKRSRLTTTVLGLAVLAAAAAGTVAVATGAEWLTPARIGAIALAVIGLGMLVGAFLHRGFGLLVVTGPLIGFVVLASLAGPIDFTSSGDQYHAPLTVAELSPRYDVRFGELQLDLRNLDLTEDHTVAIDTRFGDTQVLLPANMDVDVVCESRFASPCPADGFDGGADGADDGPVLTLDLNTHFANTEVHRD